MEEIERKEGRMPRHTPWRETALWMSREAAPEREQHGLDDVSSSQTNKKTGLYVPLAGVLRATIAASNVQKPL